MGDSLHPVPTLIQDAAEKQLDWPTAATTSGPYLDVDARPTRKPPFRQSEANRHEGTSEGPDLQWLGSLDDSADQFERGGISQVGERVAGRLRQHADIWRANTSDPFVLRVLENGLELPFEDSVYPLEHHATRSFIKDDDDLT